MSGQARYLVAVDLGKYKHSATVLDLSRQQSSKTITIAVNKEGFHRFEALLSQYSSDPTEIIIGCEATGHYGETLLRRLQGQGYAIVRMNPAQVVQFRRGLGRRAKTDALDAQAMAQQLSVMDYHPEQPPTDTCRAIQHFTRLRLDLVEEQGRWINRVRALLNQLCPELEAVLTEITAPTTLRLLATYPSRLSLAAAPIEELTELVRKVSDRGINWVTLNFRGTDIMVEKEHAAAVGRSWHAHTFDALNI